MSVAKIHDVSHVRFRAPDLDKMRTFMLDFGMVEAQMTDTALYMRGYGPRPFLHATEKGDAGFAALGLVVNDRTDLEALAAHDAVTIEPLDAPGGGEVVRLRDPDGHLIEVVSGQTTIEPESAPDPMHWNEKGRNERIASFRRIAKGPSHVLRLGHVVLGVSNFRVSEAWYKERFGLITSDEIQPAPGVAIGAFMRADRGEETSDHHTIFLLQHPDGPAYLHAAFEVVDLDDLMVGHDHLATHTHQPVWGIGRHKLGSQIFDYWNDPWGHEIEHWTDGDQLKASDGGHIASMDDLIGVQWGMPFPGELP